jgi:hypothetical protein
MWFLNTFHRRVPIDSLCLYRAALGFLIFVESAQWLPYSVELFSNAGFHVPHIPGFPTPEPLIAFNLVLALMGTSLMVCLGLFTRTSLAVTLVLWSYLYGIDRLNEKSAHTIAMLGLFLLLFSACHQRYSLDNWLRKRRGLAEYPGEASIFMLRILQLAFANIYFFSGLVKMQNPQWVDGTAFTQVLNCRWVSPIGTMIYKLQLPVIGRIGGLFTILFELFEGFFLLTPQTKYFGIALGLFFHGGIEVTMRIGSLGWHMMIALVFLFPDPWAFKELMQHPPFVRRRRLGAVNSNLG